MSNLEKQRYEREKKTYNDKKAKDAGVDEKLVGKKRPASSPVKPVVKAKEEKQVPAKKVPSTPVVAAKIE